MPYNAKERKLMSALKKKYGVDKGKDIYFAMENQAKHGKKHMAQFGARTKRG